MARTLDHSRNLMYSAAQLADFGCRWPLIEISCTWGSRWYSAPYSTGAGEYPKTKDMEKQHMRDPYSVFGVSQNASDQEIKKAYRESWPEVPSRLCEQPPGRPG